MGEQCPLYVGQEYLNGYMGIPVRFSNWKSRVGFVPESENLNIEMDIKATICVQSTYWRVTSYPGYLLFYISACPKPDADFFQIKKAEDPRGGYTIVFCRSGDFDYIGVGEDEYGLRRLVLSTTPFPFVFMKSNGTVTSSKTMLNI